MGVVTGVNQLEMGRAALAVLGVGGGGGGGGGVATGRTLGFIFSTV